MLDHEAVASLGDQLGEASRTSLALHEDLERTGVVVRQVAGYSSCADASDSRHYAQVEVKRGVGIHTVRHIGHRSLEEVHEMEMEALEVVLRSKHLEDRSTVVNPFPALHGEGDIFDVLQGCTGDEAKKMWHLLSEL